MQTEKVKRKKKEQTDKSSFLAQWVVLQILTPFIAVVILVFYTYFEFLYRPNWITLLDHILIPLVLISMFIPQHVTLRHIMPRTLFKASLLFILAFLVSAFTYSFSDNHEIFLSEREPLKLVLLSSALILPFLIAQGIVFWRNLAIPSLRRILIYSICNLVGYPLFWYVWVTFNDLVSYLGILLLLIQGFLVLWVINDNGYKELIIQKEK